MKKSEEERKKQADILAEARKRFKRAKTFQSIADQNWLNDYKFAEADSYNMFQWPEEIASPRELNDEPCLTINKTRQHNLQIINDSKQNKPGIGVRPVGNNATFGAAQTIAGLIRHIEYQSDAQTHYDTATEFQVKAGIGYLRLLTKYADNETFDQDIFIEALPNPLAVYMDPDAKRKDKTDQKFCFIFEDQDRDEFEKENPELANDPDIGGSSVLGEDEMDGWFSQNNVRKAEYYRIVTQDDELIAYNNLVSGKVDILPLSKIPSQFRSEILAAEGTRRRPIQIDKVEWIFIIGQKIVETREWVGSMIPVIPVIGEETVIEGKLDRKGHTRALLDPQRMYNYWSSTAVYYGALQTKIPWTAPAAAIEGYENYWDTANRISHSVLPYNAYDDNGQQLPPPQRTDPPVPAPVALQGMQTASMEMMLVSGQYEAGMGAQGNERSAKAIDKRQRQGENATYHFIDNLAIAIRAAGKMILEILPKIYDAPRTVQILAEDNAPLEVQIDPSAAQAFQLQDNENREQAIRILNPKVGKYEVQIDVGPAFATKREEAFNAFTLILTQAPHLVPIIGDILFKAGDFPMANEAAERLRRLVPKEALGLGPSQNEQVLMQQVEQLKGVLSAMLDELAKVAVQLKNKEQEIGVKDYQAHTERLKVVSDHTTDILQSREIVEDLATQILQETREEIERKSSAEGGPPPIPKNILAVLRGATK